MPLSGQVAVVAGATRGAGRGIALALGEAGAAVYCTGRSTRDNPSPYKRPATIEETAEMIATAGGRAVAIRVDHTLESEVQALFERVDKEHKSTAQPLAHICETAQRSRSARSSRSFHCTRSSRFES